MGRNTTTSPTSVQGTQVQTAQAAAQNAAEQTLTLDVKVLNLFRDEKNPNKYTSSIGIAIDTELDGFDENGAACKKTSFSKNKRELLKELSLCGDEVAQVTFAKTMNKMPTDSILSLLLTGATLKIKRVFQPKGTTLETANGQSVREADQWCTQIIGYTKVWGQFGLMMFQQELAHPFEEPKQALNADSLRYQPIS